MKKIFVQTERKSYKLSAKIISFDLSGYVSKWWWEGGYMLNKPEYRKGK